MGCLVTVMLLLPSHIAVVTDAANANIAIRIPRIRIGIEATRTGVNAIIEIAAADEGPPGRVVHVAPKSPLYLFNRLRHVPTIAPISASWRVASPTRLAPISLRSAP